MLAPTSKPTSSETSLAQRRQMVDLRAAGWTVSAIADEVGCSPRTVWRWLARARDAGEAGLAYRSRRPHTPHPQTTPSTVVADIQRIRTAHPGWGARLIRRQLLLDGGERVPSEVTIAAWLSRLGYGLVRPRRSKVLGWRPHPPTSDEVLWQIDFKQKGGSGT